MTLEDDLARRRQELRAGLPPLDLRTVREAIERNRMLQLAEQSLAVGDLLPDFTLPDADGRPVRSDELLDSGPVVLAFFRGGWCPYCDVALRALEAARPRIEAVGAQLVGISPETPAELRQTAAERGLGFRLLSDADAAFARLCGIRYVESDAVKAIYRHLGIWFPARDADGIWSLPLPVTYIVAPDARLAWIFVDPDWSYRAEPDELIRAVQRLATPHPLAGVSAISTKALTGGE